MAQRTARPAAPPPLEAAPEAEAARPRVNWRLWGKIALGALAALIIFIGIAVGISLSRDPAKLARESLTKFAKDAGGTLTLGNVKPRIWPRPGISLEAFTFETSDGSAKLASPRATVSYRIFDSLDGAIDRPVVNINNADLRLSLGPLGALYSSPRTLTNSVGSLLGLFEKHADLRGAHFALRRARITLLKALPDGQDLTLEPMDVFLGYDASRGTLEASIKRVSEQNPVEASLVVPTMRALKERKTLPTTLKASGYGSRFAFSGDVTLATDITVSGTFETSLRDVVERALGFRLSEREKADDGLLGIAGRVVLDQRGGSFENLRLKRGNGSLTGIAAMRVNSGRWSLSATLAGDLVDGTATHAAIQRLRGPEGRWSARPLDVNPAPGYDLDIRLSTRHFKLGELTLNNAALSIFTRQGRAEFAISDAKHGTGSLKARVMVTERNAGQDIRLSASGEKLDAESFLTGALGIGRIRGTGAFALQAESQGASVAELVANLAANGQIEIRNGEVNGIDLNRLMARAGDARPELALFAALGGKTAFESIALSGSIRDGKLEPTGSGFTSARALGQLDGHVDLIQQRHHLTGTLKRRQETPGQASEFFGFRIEGPLFSPALRPDFSLLQKRE